MMMRQHAFQHPTLLEIANALGITPDTVLEWIIEGRVTVALQGAQVILMVDKNQSLKNCRSGNVLILTKHLSNQKWRKFSC
jgi:hypothetical protein